MRNPRLMAATIAIYVLAGGVAFAAEPTWGRDFKSAKESGETHDEPLFILFTGHGWCHACELELVAREVFQTEGFL